MTAFLKDLALFPLWWLIGFPRFQLSFLKKLLQYLDQKLAVVLMIRFLFVPLFGDVSIVGLIISVIFRLLRAFFGTILIGLTLISFLILIVIWYLIPPILFFQFPFHFPIIVILSAAVFAGIKLLFKFENKRFEKGLILETNGRLEPVEGKAAKVEETEAVLSWLRLREEWSHPPFLWDDRYVIGPMGGVNRALTGRVTPILDAYSVDLTREAGRGKLPPMLGKEKPFEEVLSTLEKRSVNNVILVGPPGCGKTSLVYGLASEIIKGTHSPALSSKRLVSLEIGVLMAGAKTGGDLSERLVGVMKDIEASANIILFIDEIHNAVAAGGGVDTSLIFSTLEPRLTSGRFQMIGATSWENYRKYIEPNEAFARLFQTVEVNEASFAETMEILKILSFTLERSYRVRITYPGLKAAIELSSQFMHDRVLPDKAVGILEEAAVNVSKAGGDGWVNKVAVERLIAEKTHIPAATISEDESKKLMELEGKMHERLIGQEEAVTAIADSIRRARLGLREKTRPIVSLLFIGPTGVGKTETAKALAEVFFGGEDRMIRVDMSEYQREDSINRLIGSPSGTERAAEGGLLTEAVRKRPFSLVLFDEIEKAHQRILDIFLQVLEDGRLTDARGRLIDFRNTILIFTSNAGTEVIFKGLNEGKNMNVIREDVFTFLQSNFRVELLNRFDGVILFNPLTRPQIEKIVRLKMKKLQKELTTREIKVNFSDDLIARLAQEGFDPALGARPLRRLIQDKIEAKLARKILTKEWDTGMTVNVGADFLDDNSSI